MPEDDELTQGLTHKSSAVRFTAVKSIHRVAQEDYHRAVRAARVCLEDGSVEVRLAVIDVLCQLVRAAPMGNSDAVDMLVDRLADWDAEVRRDAVDALANAVKKCDRATLQAVRDHLGNWQAHVRRTAVKAISVLAKRGDEATIRSLCACLRDTDAEVRAVAIGALPALTTVGDKSVAEGLTGPFDSTVSDERRIAAKGVQEMIGMRARAFPDIIPALLRCARDPVVEVRRATMESLAAASPKGNIVVLNALTFPLAVAPLPLPVEKKVVKKNSDSSSSSSKTHSDEEESEEEEEPDKPEQLEQDRSWAVRKAAVEGLAKAAQRGDERIIAVVAARLEDESSEVRRAASASTQEIARYQHSPSAMRFSAEALDHQLADVRLVGLQTLSGLVRKDDQRAIATILGHTGPHENTEVRRAALKALEQVVSTPTTRVGLAVASCARDHSVDVRRTALQLLPKLVPSTVPEDVPDGPVAPPAFKRGIAKVVTAGPEAKKLGLEWSEGRLVVTKVGLASWAEASRLDVGDEVLELDGVPLRHIQDLGQALAVRPLELKVHRPLFAPPKEPDPSLTEVLAEAQEAMVAGLRDRDPDIRAIAAGLLAVCGGEPEVEVRSTRMKQWESLDRQWEPVEQ